MTKGSDLDLLDGNPPFNAADRKAAVRRCGKARDNTCLPLERRGYRFVRSRRAGQVEDLNMTFGGTDYHQWILHIHGIAPFRKGDGSDWLWVS